MTYCWSVSGTAKFSCSMQFDELLASLSIWDVGSGTFWSSSATEMLTGSFKLISARRVTPKPQAMRDTWGPVWAGMMCSQKKNQLTQFQWKRVRGKDPVSHPQTLTEPPHKPQPFQGLPGLAAVDSTRTFPRHYFSWLCWFTVHKCLYGQTAFGRPAFKRVWKKPSRSSLCQEYRSREAWFSSCLSSWLLVWYRAKHTTPLLPLAFCLNSAFAKQTNELSGSWWLCNGIWETYVETMEVHTLIEIPVMKEVP